MRWLTDIGWDIVHTLKLHALTRVNLNDDFFGSFEPLIISTNTHRRNDFAIWRDSGRFNQSNVHIAIEAKTDLLLKMR